MTDDSLRTIAIRMGTDKEGAHSYTDAYDRHLGHLRREPITLLEIGIGGYADPAQGGASLRAWKAYFPFARIIGLDIEDKSPLAEERITILRGDQGDKDFLEQMALEHGPFDIVIDDGSHHCKHVIASFEALFPHVTEHGIYAIEDLQTSYWETYGGSSSADRTGTSMTMLHALVDGLNYSELDVVGYEPTYSDRWVRSATFYHNLAFIEKGQNLPLSHLLPPHPRDTRHFAKADAPSGRKGTHRLARTPRGVIRAVLPLRIRRAAMTVAHTVRHPGRGRRPKG